MHEHKSHLLVCGHSTGKATRRSTSVQAHPQPLAKNVQKMHTLQFGFVTPPREKINHPFSFVQHNTDQQAS